MPRTALSLREIRQRYVENLRLLDDLLLEQGEPIPEPILYVQPTAEVKAEFAAAIDDLVSRVCSGQITEHRFLECVESWGKVFRDTRDATPVRHQDLVKLALGSRC